MYRAGKIGLKSVSKAAKKLKMKPRELKDIGAGAESINHLVTHPKAGVAVQKTFNPRSAYFSHDTFEKKVKIMKDLKKNKSFAKYLGRKKKKPVIYQEYIKEKPKVKKGFGDSIDAQHRKNTGTLTKAEQSFESRKNQAIKKHHLADINKNPSNAISSKKGKKIIDFLVTDKTMKGSPMGRTYSSHLRFDKTRPIIKSVGEQRTFVPKRDSVKKGIKFLKAERKMRKAKRRHIYEIKNNPMAIMRRAHGN
jgi:hypothetical protein